MWKWFYQHRHHPKWTCGCFLPIYRYHSIYSKKYTNFKNKSLFNNSNILDINDFYNRNRGNVSLTYWVAWKINTLSNQDFVGMDEFRLRASLRKIKDMHVKMNKMNKVNRNESREMMGDFLNLFLLEWSTCLLAAVLGKVHHWHWTKESLWKVSSLEHTLTSETCSYLHESIRNWQRTENP